MFEEIKSKLNEMERRQGELYVSLNKSLDIQTLWPEAFAHGPCNSKTVGNVNHPLESRFIITDGAGNTKEFPIPCLPYSLISKKWVENMTHNARGRDHAFNKWLKHWKATTEG